MFMRLGIRKDGSPKDCRYVVSGTEGCLSFRRLLLKITVMRMLVMVEVMPFAPHTPEFERPALAILQDVS